jgi:hypothetical protein
MKGAEGMGIVRFHDALYQLADNWTHSTDPVE